MSGGRICVPLALLFSAPDDHHAAQPPAPGPPARSAVRGLSNYMFHEAQRLAKEEVQKGNDKFDG